MSTQQDKQIDELLENISKLEGRDKVGVTGEVLSTLTGAAVGSAAAGGLAAAVGVTTIPVLTTAASWFGIGLFFATPIGWVAGAGAAGGAILYAFAKLVRSGGKQDQIRSDLIKRLNKIAKEKGELAVFCPARLEVAVKRAIDAGLDRTKAERLVSLVAKGQIDGEIAIKRLEAISKTGECP